MNLDNHVQSSFDLRRTMKTDSNPPIGQECLGCGNPVNGTAFCAQCVIEWRPFAEVSIHGGIITGAAIFLIKGGVIQVKEQSPRERLLQQQRNRLKLGFGLWLVRSRRRQR